MAEAGGVRNVGCRIGSARRRVPGRTGRGGGVGGGRAAWACRSPGASGLHGPPRAGSAWTGGYSCSARWLAGLDWVLCAAQVRVREPCRPCRRWLPGYRAGTASAPGWCCRTYQAIGRGGAARAHGGDPQGGGPAQIVGGSGARAGNFSPLPAGEVLGAGPAAIVMAVLSALGSAVPAAGRARGWSGVAGVLTVPGEGFDGPVEPVACGHLIMALSTGPSVERMVNRHLTSAGSPHLMAPSSSR